VDSFSSFYFFIGMRADSEKKNYTCICIFFYMCIYINIYTHIYIYIYTIVVPAHEGACFFSPYHTFPPAPGSRRLCRRNGAGVHTSINIYRYLSIYLSIYLYKHIHVFICTGVP